MLPPRTGAILKSIVEQYIAEATAVSSGSIVRKHALAVSSATVRNEMARLEEEGYINRSHPSAGGMPTDKGYRYYVESLTDIKLPLAEQRMIDYHFQQLEKEIEKWLSLSAMLIARLSQNVAIATPPKPPDCQVKHLELVTLQERLALVVLVLRGAKIKKQLVAFNQAVAQPELTAIASRLNVLYSGLTRTQILARNLEFPATEQRITDSLVKIMQAEDEQSDEEPYLDGWYFMLSQPEFVQSRRMLALMELAEYRKLLKTIIPQPSPSPGVRVIIGKENRAKVIQNYSVVTKQYGLPDEATGTISVIGPTRMPYARTIATVDYLSSLLSEFVMELYGR